MRAEVWKPVLGYEGAFEVSSNGAVRSVKRQIVRRNGAPLSVEGRTLKPSRCARGGYLVVNLKFNGTSRVVTVHSLVAAAFIGPRPQGFDVCHTDGNPVNNAAENLRYGTRRENIEDTKRHGRLPRGSGHHNSVLTEAKAREARQLVESGMKKSDVAARFGITRPTLTAVLKRQTWEHA